MKRIYLDHAASTPLDPAVLRAMKPYFSENFANPGSLHIDGQLAMAALDKSRETIANHIGAKFDEVIFTSSATEANNLALRGLVLSSNSNPRIIVSAVEHESVLETARDLERNGGEVVYIPVNKEGIVDLKRLKAALNERTVLVSVMYANNEIGTIQPISEISGIIRDFRIRSQESRSMRQRHDSGFMIRDSGVNRGSGFMLPALHTDAVQALQYLDCNVDRLGVDMMTLSSHKIYGPKGAGALYVRSMKYEAGSKNGVIRGSRFMIPVLTGGGQEFGLRSGTENIPAIVGFVKAVEIVSSIKHKEVERVKMLRNYLWKDIKEIYKRARLNGSETERLPNNLNVYFPGVNAQDFLVKLDLSGIAASSGSACDSRSMEPSHVIEAIDGKRAISSIRFTLGRHTTQEEVDQAAKILSKLLKHN